MPDEDGYSLIQQIRLLSPAAGGQIYAIAMTAYASEAEQQRALDAGFHTHMAKPVDPVQMAWAIANWRQ
jgi:two-component system, chemotaxis family, CheB/CheR fusion protein